MFQHINMLKHIVNTPIKKVYCACFSLGFYRGYKFATLEQQTYTNKPLYTYSLVGGIIGGGLYTLCAPIALSCEAILLEDKIRK